MSAAAATVAPPQPLVARCPVESALATEWLGQTDARSLPVAVAAIVHDYQHEVGVIDVVNGGSLARRRDDDGDGQDTGDGERAVVDRGAHKYPVEASASCCRHLLEWLWSTDRAAASATAYWTSVLVPLRAVRVEVPAFRCGPVQIGVDRTECYWKTVTRTDARGAASLADGRVSECSEIALRSVTDWSGYRGDPIVIGGAEYAETREQLQFYVGHHFRRGTIEQVIRGALFAAGTRLETRRLVCDSTAKGCAVHPVEVAQADTVERTKAYVTGCESARVQATVERQLRERGVRFDRIAIGSTVPALTLHMRAFHVPLGVRYGHERSGSRQDSGDMNGQDAEPIEISCPATGKRQVRRRWSFLRLVACHLVLVLATCVAYASCVSFADLRHSFVAVAYAATVGPATIACVLGGSEVLAWRNRVDRRRARRQLHAELAESGILSRRSR